MSKLPPPRKRFGQHFLTDRTHLTRIVDAFAPLAGQNILEVGPGRGALTDALLKRMDCAETDAPAITAVELDRDLAAYLQRRYSPRQVCVVQHDILRFQLPAAAGKWRIVGNLPYQISTPLLFRFLAQIGCIDDMLFTVQKEVAMRLVAAPGCKNYGRLSVMLGLELDSEVLFDIAPEAFSPPPKVTSSVVRLVPKRIPLRAKDAARLQAIVAAAFNQRRKTIRNSLAGVVRLDAMRRAGVAPGSRAEEVSAEEFVRLAEY